ncbi:pre-B-cell leukemia transcription factor-interacting protein 1 isoform X2 [Gymnodraco acuticeps]|uniref:Pre-B-cell leukemia transcription factor-interacting protein 1 isoform X2 n=1 Tax=Gymnodraco acuticeps TaxID=8218 RepID=A0A6P8UJQ8_GYMAC|nr:pre-B-cell leukemia transcription factor-interacting protein 1 isoform X2 [Gymnodraco acuticeps]
MSDHSNSTGSSGSSTNSWTLLSPEEAAVENVGPLDDGTESLGDAPSLSEDMTGAAAASSEIPIETVLSEEGHQVCQETSPEPSEIFIPSSPPRMSPVPPNLLDTPDLDLESQPPVIHDIVTSSPSDNEHLGATPFVTNIDMGAPRDVSASELLASEPEDYCDAPPVTEIPAFTEEDLDTPADIGMIPASPAVEGPDFTTEPEVSFRTETLTATDPPSHVEDDMSFVPDSPEPPSYVPDTESLVTESPISESPAPETVGSLEAEEKEEEKKKVEEEKEAAVEKEDLDTTETVTQYEREEEEEEEEDPSSSFDDGLRRRNVPSYGAQRPRTSDEDDEDEEMEFMLAEKKEEKPWLSLNKCIVGSLILLFLASLFLSGDFDASELSDVEQSQDWLSGDPQDMKELLDKLTQEKQHMAQLEAQLQSQKEELDLALKAVAVSGDEKGKADLEKENVKLKDELSSLPELKKELESLRSRVTELSQLSADEEMLPATSSSAPQPGDKEGQSNQKEAAPERKKDTYDGGRLKEELHRQKVLLEESKKRLQGMKKNGGDRKRVRDSLEEIRKRLSEQVERWGKKKPQEPKWKGNKVKNNEQWKKDEKKEWRGEKDRKKEGGWREKEEKKQNSHKEAWRKNQAEWERKKDERRMDREERRKEKPWHSHHGKSFHNHNIHNHQQPHHFHQQPHHSHQPHQPQQHKHSDFWRDQEQKLRRSVRSQPGCTSVEDCAGKEGLYPVELPEFEELLEGYLSKLEGSSSESKDKIRKLTAEFFEDGVFIHDRVLFSDFAEDVADILEDMVDILEGKGQKDNDSLEEEMEEFEREALWKFAATA